MFIDRYTNEFELNYTRIITQDIEFGIGYEYTNTIYKDDITVSSFKRREDKLNRYSAYITYDIVKDMGLIVQYDYYDNQTNYIPSKYEKEVVSAGIYFYY